MNGLAENTLKLYGQLEQELAALIGPVRFSADSNLRLERMTQLMGELGDPQRSYPAIHVGGTSGKGSTAAMAAAILTAAGYKTGLHTKPHLQILNERHRINGRLVPTSRLWQLYNELRPALERVAEQNPFGRPSYFEAQVALSFLLFQRDGVDAAVIEVGLGGTLDATNVLPAQVAVVTNIGLDHTEILGDTIEAIAHEKAGIIKRGQTVISGVRQPSARAIIIERCVELGATLWQLGVDFDYDVHNSNLEAQNRMTLHLPHMSITDLTVGAVGPFQMSNAALATTAAYALPEFSIPQTAVQKALATAELPGRMEQMQQSPTVILDGAHNPDKIQAAAAALDQLVDYRRRIVVFALKSDKAAAELLAPVVAGADHLIITTFHVKGLWEPHDPVALASLAAEQAPDLPIDVISDPYAAVDAALAMADTDDLIWVTGSLYLVGDVRERWYPAAQILVDAEAQRLIDAG